MNQHSSTQLYIMDEASQAALVEKSLLVHEQSKQVYLSCLALIGRFLDENNRLSSKLQGISVFLFIG